MTVNRDASACRRAVKTSTASPPRRRRVDGVEVDANFRARRRRERRETLILARLATAGVSLFLFLAMLCNCGRVTASGDAKADCYDTRVHERAVYAMHKVGGSSRGAGSGFARFSQVATPLHIVLLSSCCVAATPRIQPPRLLGLRRRAHARSPAMFVPCGRPRASPPVGSSGRR